ncbi:MAG TPA: DUF188 domain-containing protein [Tissierellaceae bacterium]|nr:DUF188 domain-containing protein [Tissierellaceae bacterium]
MKIYIDADGCPVVDEAISIAKEYELEVIVVKNYAHEIKDDYATIVSVDISRDSADFYIANAIVKGDIVVTQDYGLAAMCLSKEAIPINQNGKLYKQENIDGMLNRRHLHRQLRKQNKFYGKAKKRKFQADRDFESSLKKVLDENK